MGWGVCVCSHSSLVLDLSSHVWDEGGGKGIVILASWEYHCIRVHIIGCKLQVTINVLFQGQQ